MNRFASAHDELPQARSRAFRGSYSGYVWRKADAVNMEPRRFKKFSHKALNAPLVLTWYWGPSAPPSSTAMPGNSARTCLRRVAAQRSREFPPVRGEQHKEPERAVKGCPFLGLLSFGQAKKVTALRISPLYPLV